jgi:hypothetical protein
MQALPRGTSASSPSTNSALRVIIPGMRVAAPLRVLHSPGVLPPAAKPGRTPRRSATARASRATLRWTRRALAQTSYTYDDLNRLLTHSVPQAVGSAVQTTYSYDLAGRTLAVYDTAGQGLTYGLDSAKRVTTVVQSAPQHHGYAHGHRQN